MKKKPLTRKMDIYNTATGVEMTIRWPTEEDYQRGRKFLDVMGASCGPLSERHLGKPEFFCLENDQQLKALFEFRRALRRSKL